MKLKDSKIIVIGGGGIGCGVAYSLCMAGYNDLLLMEKNSDIASETTSQGAGLVGQLRDDIDRVSLAKWSVDVFDHLQAKAKIKPEWNQVGSLRVALTEEKASEFEELRRIAINAGVNTEWISSEKAKELWPYFDFSSTNGVLWCGTDGYLSPSKLAQSYSDETKKMGGEIATGTWVEEIFSLNGKVTGVKTNLGTISCDILINAAGAHAWHIANMAGLDLPIFPIRHEYLVSSDIENINPNIPTMRIPEASLYLRAKNNGLLLGGWEQNSISVDPKEFKNDERPPKIKEDIEVMNWFKKQIMPIKNDINKLEIKDIYKGWPTFVPDGKFIVGPTKILKGFIMAAGCNAHGISGSAGIGKHVLESITQKTFTPYLSSLSPDRFIDKEWKRSEAIKYSQHVYEGYYK